MTTTERNTLAAAHELIAARPGITRGQLTEDGRILGRAFWAVDQLLARGMIVALVNAPGVHGVETRYATVRAARAAKAL